MTKINVYVSTEWPFNVILDLEDDVLLRDDATYLANSILKAVEMSEMYEHFDQELHDDIGGAD